MCFVFFFIRLVQSQWMKLLNIFYGFEITHIAKFPFRNLTPWCITLRYATKNDNSASHQILWSEYFFIAETESAVQISVHACVRGFFAILMHYHRQFLITYCDGINIPHICSICINYIFRLVNLQGYISYGITFVIEERWSKSNVYLTTVVVVSCRG